MWFCIRLLNFVQIGAPTTEIWRFQFRICWCHCLQKVKVYQQTKFRRHISIHGWDITTSGLERQMSVKLVFYFRFQSRPFGRKCRVILHEGAEFRPNLTIRCGIMTSYRFSRWRQSAMLYLLWGNSRPPTKVWTRSSNRLFVGLIVPEILRCIDFGVLAWNCLFTLLLGSFRGIFSPYDVIHRPDSQKVGPWAETRRLSHSA